MATNEQKTFVMDQNELAPGAAVSLYVNGARWKGDVLELRGNILLLSLPAGKRGTLAYGQTACLVQMLPEEQILFFMLRYVECRGRGMEMKDVFQLVPGTRMVIWPELHRLPMYSWCRLKVFTPHQPGKTLLEDQAFLFALSEGEASMMVGRPLPLGAFAECALPLADETVTAAGVLMRCENLDNGACYRAHFMLIDKTLRLRLRDFLLTERARRMQTTAAP